MLFLLTNDDGIDAPGLAAQHEALSGFLAEPPWRDGKATEPVEIVVVAPDRGRSECGHSVTTGRELYLREVRPGWFSLDGTPVDCVRVALTTICPRAAAVFSGINAGANVGVDLLVSGTFAAAREAALLGRPAMAISHYRRPDVVKTWEHTGRWLRPVFAQFFEQFPTRLRSDATTEQPTEGCFVPAHGPLWNVNLPAIEPTGCPPEVVYCPVEKRPLIRRSKWMSRHLRWQKADGEGGAVELSGEKAPSILARSDAEEQTVTSDSTQLPQGDLREGHVAMTSNFHDRPRSEGTDVDRCFSGGLTVSVLQPHLF